MRRLLLLLLAAPVVGVGLAAIGYRFAIADPLVRRADVSLPDWPAGASPVKIALLGDIHIGNAATGPARVVRIADRVNALRPDLVVLAGDFIAGHDPANAAAAAGLVPGLTRLRAPLGVVAVLGNHDHWTTAGQVTAALRQAGVTVLANTAVHRGPLMIGGADDLVTGHADLAATDAAMRAGGGARVLLSHSPDVAPDARVGLVLAGHTHCGRIVIPGYGPPVDVSRYGRRYRCGLVREGGRTTVITAGTGTSALPLRLGAPPDIWLIRVGP